MQVTLKSWPNLLDHYSMLSIQSFSKLALGDIKYSTAGLFRVTGESFYPNGVQPDIKITDDRNALNNPRQQIPHLNFLQKIEPASYESYKLTYSMEKLRYEHLQRKKNFYVAPTGSVKDDPILGEAMQILIDLITSDGM